MINIKASDGTKLDISSIPESASEAPITNEKPHTMNMNMNTQQHEEEILSKPVVFSNENSAELSEEDDATDDDVEDLIRLEEDILYQKLIKKYFSKLLINGNKV